MIKKITNSLAFRLPMVYKRLLRYRPLIIKGPKISSSHVVLMMAGKKIMDLTRISVFSIAKNWDSLPKLIITSDGSITAGEIRNHLEFWPGELVVQDWQEIENYHRQKSRANLLRYAQSHVLGKKLAVVLYHAEIQPVIWIDSDIIFYQDFNPYINRYDGFFCGGSEEGHSLYDDRVLDFYNHDLYQVYTFSSGLLNIYGPSIYEDFRLEQLLSEVSNYTHYFTEQTIFAHIASQSLGMPWTRDIIKNDHLDKQQVRPMSYQNVIGRHYTANVRHLFWRDAFFNL